MRSLSRLSLSYCVNTLSPAFTIATIQHLHKPLVRRYGHGQPPRVKALSYACPPLAQVCRTYQELAAIVNGSSLVIAEEDETAVDWADEFRPGAVASRVSTSTTARSFSATLQYE